MTNTSLPIANSQSTINIDAWLQQLLATHKHDNPELVRQVVSLARIAGEDRATPSGKSCLAQGLEMAEILNGLFVDCNTLAAAVLYSSVQYADLQIDDIAEHIGQKVTKLIFGTKQMDGISELYRAVAGREQYKQHNIDNIRKMLLAMVDDIRVVLIKLAEHLFTLRAASILSAETKHAIAAESMAIYAPLANRLGIAQIKWELEDIAFHYLEPEKYQGIVDELNKSFPERKAYINKVIAELKQILHESGLVNFQVTGRIKHIFSIYRKMCRKQVNVSGIFDVGAVRIFVPTITDCYTALSHVHAAWQYIPEEFDDYIASPKTNNYRSIHTTVIGPENKIVEIQIRSYDMHKHAELGIAAHWIYKEGKGAGKGADYETKIAWLRQVMDWQQEVTGDERALEEVRQMFNDQVYVFTPEGDILDLVQGSTPLDFAYHVHSEVGHSCCGAKVNGNIVPLTHVLKTGERVEILTTKNGRPSRDWLNSNLGYLKTSRARAKVYHWFKKQSQDHNIAQGQALLDKELNRLGLKKINLLDIAEKFNFKNVDDFLASLGNGEVKLSGVLSVLQSNLENISGTPKDTAVKTLFEPKAKKPCIAKDLKIYGVDNLLTRIASCCKPVPGDSIIGYITQGKGITIHRDDCLNALFSLKHHPEKIIFVSWEGRLEKHYPVDIVVNAYDRTGLVHDITDILKEDKIMVVGLELRTDKKEGIAHIFMTIEVEGLKPLSRILAKIERIPNVIEVTRKK
jgi:GTP pyrophosphokinase